MARATVLMVSAERPASQTACGSARPDDAGANLAAAGPSVKYRGVCLHLYQRLAILARAECRVRHRLN
ncbi:hypothetical protein EVAR_41747_1 [Eumeta japonica]|uniref:Uncharacterized protein n=1 Tax=Eumeta variegata TaxID=151549 RepID=A0A4C1VYK0_EUMVA|nr:hypothetical protein EVAR_41747_1 [Eumeta japonica]